MLNGGWISMPDWQDEGFALSTRRHGEKAAVLSVFTRNHGRYLGLIHTKNLPMTACFYQLRWHARLSEHLGNFTIEPTRPLSALFLDDKKRLACLSSLCFLLDELLPEREIQSVLYDSVNVFLLRLAQDDWQAQYIRLEAFMLSCLGFGMDLTCCAGGGDRNNLAYVSPKTARAVSLEKGNPYKEKLLPLPRFLWQDVSATEQDLRLGLSLTGYFLSKQITKMPLTRHQIV